MPPIGICGTFDVENYGDLLFPLIAEHELRQRLESVTLRRFSYRDKHTPDWPFSVVPSSALTESVAELRGMIVGGGHIVRTDKTVAPGYFPSAPGLHHPLSLWLTPMLLAQQQGLAVVWNAPGVNGEIPAWIAPLVAAGLAASDYVCVRDENSRAALAALAPTTEISIVPDSAFGIPGLCDPESPSADCIALRERIGLRRPYLVIQATTGLDAVVRALVNGNKQFDAYQVLVLPISPIHGDSNAVIDRRLFPQILTLPQWPHPLLLAELIAGAEAVVGVSLHLAITALAFGVPVFRPNDSAHGKYAVLQQFDTVYPFFRDREISPDWLRSKLGRAPPSAAVRDANSKLKIHWDRIATAFAAPWQRAVPLAIRELWQKLPGELESGATAAARLSQAQNVISGLRAENAALRNSLSWKLTAPIRRVLDVARRVVPPATRPESRQPDRSDR